MARKEKALTGNIGGRPIAEVMEAAANMGRYCFMAMYDSFDKHGYIPCMAEEGKPGYSPMTGSGVGSAPWYWGKTQEECQAVCDKKNADLGLSPHDVAVIISSTMRSVVAAAEADDDIPEGLDSEGRDSDDNRREYW